MKKFYEFKNGQEMLDVIQSGIDLYCKESNSYVFIYNDSGSICFYDIDEEKASELRDLQERCHDYWSAFLEWGGAIYDNLNYNGYDESSTSNLEICNECYNDGSWEDVTRVDEMNII